VVRPIAGAPARQVLAATPEGAWRAPATEAMLGILAEAAESWKETRAPALAEVS
jgi:hypothetical protein